MKFSLVLALVFCFCTSMWAAQGVHIKVVSLQGKTLAQGDLSPSSASTTFSNLPPGEVKFEVSNGAGKTIVISGDLDGDGSSDCVVSPRDPASGQATGKRQHKPVTFVKEWSSTGKTIACVSDADAKTKFQTAVSGGKSKEDVYVWKVTCADGACTIEVLSYSWGVSNSSR